MTAKTMAMVSMGTSFWYQTIKLIELLHISLYHGFMTLLLDPHGSGPLHERIAATVRGAIANLDLARGARLPSARDLAAQLDVNVNTVLRAYRTLADEELIELRRGRGATVRAEPDLARLYEMADELLAEAARLGVTRGELTALLMDRW